MKVDNDSLGYADPVVYSKNLEPMKIPGSYGPDLFHQYISGFLERNREKRFFLYYPMFLTHFDFKPTPDSPQWMTGDRHEKNKRFFPDMVSCMDKNVGRIVDKLEELGLREKTLVMFVGDNGTHQSIVSYMGEEEVKGGKSWLTEAGTHVPMIVNWPGTVPAGQVIDDLVDPTDFFATIREATGAMPLRPPGDGALDGVSFLSRVSGGKGTPREWILIEYFFENRRLFVGQEGRYARDRRWKLYDGGTSKRLDKNGNTIPYYKGGMLFDLDRDPDERTPIKPEQGAAEAKAARSRLENVLLTHQSEGQAKPSATNPEAAR
jgi:arylsulfatase A